MAIGSTEIEVDLGTKHTAYIPLEDFSGDPSVKPEDVVHVGDEIEAIVVHVNDGKALSVCPRSVLRPARPGKRSKRLSKSKEVLEGVVTEENKGGIVVNVKGVRVFVPASQSGVPKGGDLNEMVGKTVQLRITEVPTVPAAASSAPSVPSLLSSARQHRRRFGAKSRSASTTMVWLSP